MGLSMFDVALKIKALIDVLCDNEPELYEQHIPENEGKVSMDFEDRNGDIYRISLELLENSDIGVEA